MEDENLLRSATRLSLLDVAAHKLTNLEGLSVKEISKYLSLIYEIAASGDLESLRGLVNAPTITQDTSTFLDDITRLRDHIVAARGIGPSKTGRRRPLRSAAHRASPPAVPPPIGSPEPEKPSPEEDTEEVPKGVKGAAKEALHWYKKWRSERREDVAKGYMAIRAQPGQIAPRGYERIRIPKDLILQTPTSALADVESTTQDWFIPKSCLLHQQPLEVIEGSIKKALNLYGLLGGFFDENLGAFFGETTTGNEVIGIATNVLVAAIFANMAQRLQLPYLEGATPARMATTALVFRFAKLIEAYWNPEHSWLGPPASILKDAKQFETKGGTPGLVLCAPDKHPIIRSDTGEPLTIGGTFMFERMWTPPNSEGNTVRRLISSLSHYSANIIPGGHKIFVTSLETDFYFRTIPILPFDSARGARPWHKPLPIFLQEVIRENINKSTLKLIPLSIIGMALLNIDRAMNTLGIPMQDRIAAIDYLGNLLLYPLFIPIVIGGGLYAKYRQIRYGLPVGFEDVKDILSQIVQWPEAILEGDPTVVKEIIETGGLPGAELPSGNFSIVREAVETVVGDVITKAHVVFTEGGEATKAYFWSDPTGQCQYAAPQNIPDYDAICKYAEGVFEEVIQLKQGGN
ncbi:hypothetical protein ACFLY9_02185 [Patescibacteria group bacterium]